ncbi:hypothetical protein TNCV_1486191 [Trichonephila clavipes]|nr:hypothetical protein TNCV_1486191 [Trichonephila clavipes]
MYSTDSIYDTSDVKPERIGEWSEDPLCFLMKAGSTLVPVITVCWSEGSQGNSSNQTVGGLDTQDLHLESWSREQFPRNTLCYPKHICCKFVCQFDNSTYSTATHEQHSSRSFPTGYRLTSPCCCNIMCSTECVFMLPRLARSPDLSPCRECHWTATPASSTASTDCTCFHTRTIGIELHTTE